MQQSLPNELFKLKDASNTIPFRKTTPNNLSLRGQHLSVKHEPRPPFRNRPVPGPFLQAASKRTRLSIKTYCSE